MSVLNYNGVICGPDGWLTLEFDQSAVRDPSGTDTECIRILISGHCYLTPPIQPMIGDQHSTPALSTAILRATNKFFEERKTLSFKVNGVEMIPHTSFVDARNGPHPIRFKVLEVTEKSFLVDLAIESHWVPTRVDANSLEEESGGILSHRWREEVSIDRHFFTTKTRRGRVAVGSSVFNSQANANGLDKLRDTLVNCSIPKGFIRINSHYTEEENGLVMGYEHHDQEQFRMPPSGVTEADGEMTVTTQRVGSPGRFQTCWVMLRGPNKEESSPDKLIKIAVSIAYSKLKLNGGVFPITAVFKEKLWRNEVFVSLTSRCNSKVKLLDLQESMKGFGKTVSLQSALLPPNPGSRGTARLILHAAAYHDPTLAQTLETTDNTIKATGGDTTRSRADMIPGG